MSNGNENGYSTLASLLDQTNPNSGKNEFGIINQAMVFKPKVDDDYSWLASLPYSDSSNKLADALGIVRSGTGSNSNNTLSGLLNSVFRPFPIVAQWAYVTDRFRRFQSNIILTDSQIEDGRTKYNGIVSCLNKAYWGVNSDISNSFLAGSWGKNTCIRPPRDVDVYFVLPNEVYYRLESYSAQTNKQSALLQEIKNTLLTSYRFSDIKGDGPVVSAKFDSYNVEIVPVFFWNADDQSYITCHTKNGGSYVVAKPLHEISAINAANTRNNNNVLPLIRMLKCWQFNCNVPIKSFCLELLAVSFLDQWTHRLKGYFYYDWMCRDFFNWLITKGNSYLVVPGTGELIFLGDAWKSRAETACRNALKACEYERISNMLQAGEAWQGIFGNFIQRNV